MSETSLFEKVSRVLPPGLREATAIVVALAYYLYATPRAEWQWQFVLLLAVPFTSLVVQWVQGRPKEHMEIWWDSLLPLAKEAGHRASEPESKDLKIEVTRRVKGGFFSEVEEDWQLVLGGRETFETDAAYYLTEVPTTHPQTRWWKGRAYRVGYYTTKRGETYEWFTTNIPDFMKQHQHLRKLRPLRVSPRKK